MLHQALHQSVTDKTNRQSSHQQHLPNDMSRQHLGVSCPISCCLFVCSCVALFRWTIMPIQTFCCFLCFPILQYQMMASSALSSSLISRKIIKSNQKCLANLCANLEPPAENNTASAAVIWQLQFTKSQVVGSTMLGYKYSQVLLSSIFTLIYVFLRMAGQGDVSGCASLSQGCVLRAGCLNLQYEMSEARWSFIAWE